MTIEGTTKPPTIYDVADLAGVSASTVSRAFSRPGRVAAETSARIRASARELGYRVHVVEPDQPRRTRVVGIMVSDASGRFDAELIDLVATCAPMAGFTVAVVLAGADEDGRQEREAVERALPALEAVILSAPRMPDAAIRVIARQRPTVVLNRLVADVPSVVRDNRTGMRQAVAHLAALGHRDVTYVGGPASSWADGVRWRSVREASLSLGLRAQRIGPFPGTTTAGVSAADQVRAARSSAVIAFNDELAIGVVRGLAAHRVRVPADVSVVGVDDIAMAGLVAPRLTTIGFSMRDMCHAAGAIVDGLLDGSTVNDGDRVRVVPSRLVVRASTTRRHP